MTRPTRTTTEKRLTKEIGKDLSTGDGVLDFFDSVRKQTEQLTAPLAIEDYGVQSMPDVSPTKWHLAHTTWFFEAFVLRTFQEEFRPYHPKYEFLFNSYYNAVGKRVPRPERGLLSRPTVKEVFQYRNFVDEQVKQLLEEAPEEQWGPLFSLVVLGLNHEQQHQELLLTDIKHVFSCNPLRPIYQDGALPDSRTLDPVQWLEYARGVQEIGEDSREFAFDNERPRHQTYLGEFALASRPVTNGEFRVFMEDEGYNQPTLWLADGWNVRQQQNWTAPLYWEKRDGRWWQFTLAGMRPVVEEEPVCHVSFFEADAFARWSGARLPTEAEWEIAATRTPIQGNFQESEIGHPLPLTKDALDHPAQMFGDVWEWTGSPYIAYPGYQPPEGALGEYNGKFMCNQMVLRGGSCATPLSHIRSTYRNFFPPEARWQFSGFRLARDL